MTTQIKQLEKIAKKYDGTVQARQDGTIFYTSNNFTLTISNDTRKLQTNWSNTIITDKFIAELEELKEIK